MADETLQNKTVTNPLDEPFVCMWDGTGYEIPARATVSMVGYLAEHLAKHLAKKILINKGRYEDIIKNDKRIGTAITGGELSHVADALLNRDGEVLDLDVLVAEAKKADPGDKSLPKGVPVVRLEETPLKEGVKVTPVIPPPIEGPRREGSLTDDQLRFLELKDIGWANLKKEERPEYQRLKNKLESKK